MCLAQSLANAYDAVVRDLVVAQVKILDASLGMLLQKIADLKAVIVSKPEVAEINVP